MTTKPWTRSAWHDRAWKRWFCANLGVAVMSIMGCTSPVHESRTVSTNLITIGSVAVDPDARCVIATGFVNQTSGPIELFACGPGGKRHESTFVMQLEAVDLQAGLLLLGLKAGKPLRSLGEGPPDGSPMEIAIEWEKGGRIVSRRADAFLIDSRTEKSLPPTPWIFTGSAFENGQFMAQAEESFIATYWDPWAIINIGSGLGSNDEWISVNPRTIPPVDTPVVFRIRAGNQNP